MRKDIEIHINTGDVVFKKPDISNISEFRWIDTPVNCEESFIYGEIVVSPMVLERTFENPGLFIEIPYTPIYKSIRLRIKTGHSSDYPSYYWNAKEDSCWFSVVVDSKIKTSDDICASELMAISDSCFNVQFKDGKAVICSAAQSDFSITTANHQNKNMLLKCVPGNNLRYPLTGVGLIRWTNGNLTVSTLAQILQDQFANDETPVIHAKYDFDTKQLYLNLDTSKVDSQ